MKEDVLQHKSGGKSWNQSLIYGLRNFEKVDACSLKTHPPFTFLNWTDNGIKLLCDCSTKYTVNNYKSLQGSIVEVLLPR